MSPPVKNSYTPEEYLALEEAADYKSEYYQGEIFMMAGGSVNHNAISSNINTELNLALRSRPCRVFSSDMKVLVSQKGYYTYTDSMVVCGEVETDPLVIVEVLSPSSQDFDRRGKFELYRAISSFQFYLIIDQKRIYLEYYQKTAEGWLLRTYQNIAEAVTLALPGGDIEIALANIYSKIAFST